MAATELAAAGIQAAAAAGTSAAISGKMNRKAVRESRRQRKWQTEERLAQQAYATEMWNKTNEWNLEQWNRQNDWNLEQWNRENDYNSAASQVQRLQQAGFSPLSYLNGVEGGSAAALDSNPVQATPASAGGAPGTSLPQMFNPAESMQVAQKQFFDYLSATRDLQRLENETVGTTADKEYKNSLKATEDALREGRVQIGNTTVELNKNKALESEQTRKNLAASIVKLDKECKQIDEYCENLKVDRDYKSWQKYCEKQKLPKEIEYLGASIMGLNAHKAESWRRQRLIDTNIEAQRHYNKNYMKDNQLFDSESKRYHMEQMRGGTYSNFGYSVLRGLNLTNQTVGTLTQGIKGYSLLRSGQQLRQQSMQQSQSNPYKVSQPDAPSINTNRYAPGQWPL